MTAVRSGNPERRIQRRQNVSFYFSGNVAELANAPDLKSVNPRGYVGSEPTVVVLYGQLVKLIKRIIRKCLISASNNKEVI